jgi:hypothetical protein
MICQWILLAMARLPRNGWYVHQKAASKAPPKAARADANSVIFSIERTNSPARDSESSFS